MSDAVVVPAGSRSGTATVTITDDAVVEGDEYFYVDADLENASAVAREVLLPSGDGVYQIDGVRFDIAASDQPEPVAAVLTPVPSSPAYPDWVPEDGMAMPGGDNPNIPSGTRGTHDTNSDNTIDREELLAATRKRHNGEITQEQYQNILLCALRPDHCAS